MELTHDLKTSEMDWEPLVCSNAAYTLWISNFDLKMAVPVNGGIFPRQTE